jgi:hypothetical protein
MSMSPLSLGIGAVLALGGAYLAFIQKKKSEGVVTELKFLKATPLAELHAAWKAITEQGFSGNYREFVETNGKAATEGELRSPHGNIPCAYFVATVERQFEREETTRDEKGNVQRRRMRSSENVSSQKSASPLYLESAGIRIPLDLDGASLDLKDGSDRFEPYESNRTYSFFNAASIQTGTKTLGFRYSEKIIPLGHPLYVVGEAKDSSGELRIGSPSEKGKPFIVSVKSEDEVIKSRESGARTQFYLGIALIVAGIAVALLVK